MKTSTVRIALGVFIAAATLAASNAAHAETWVRWKNKSEPSKNADLAGVEPHRRVELERVAAGRRLRVAIDDADLLAKLVPAL